MKKIGTSIVLLILLSISSAFGKAPYIVFSASDGVILYSKLNGEIVNPIRGEEVYKDDVFYLSDDRYWVKIKDTGSGEIFSYSGEGKVTPLMIVSSQKYNFFKRFLYFLSQTAKESGFETTPVLTTQCVSVKGENDSELNELTLSAAEQIREAIANNNYCQGVTVSKVMTPENDSYYFSVSNEEDYNYAFAAFTIGESGNEVHPLNDVIVDGTFGPRKRSIAFIPLPGHTSIDLTYCTMAASEDDPRTCYIIVFDTLIFYPKQEDNRYSNYLDWEYIKKVLLFQGDLQHVIMIGR